MIEFTLRIYEKKNGKMPFYEWLMDQDVTIKQIIRTRLDRLSLGNFSNNEPVGDGINEIKVNTGPGYRIYYGIIDSKIVLILCSGDKSTQDKDIKKAKEYFKDYKMRGKPA